MNSENQQNDSASATVPARSAGTARRVFLTIAIIGGALVFMVLPWAFLFHSPEQFAGWAVSGVVLAVAMHLFLSTRKRRQAFQEMLEEIEEDEEEEEETETNRRH